jgi:hypothetical protein
VLGSLKRNLVCHNVDISIDVGLNRIEIVNREVFGGLAAEVVDIDLHLNKLYCLPTDVFKGRRFFKIDLSKYISHISLQNFLMIFKFSI